jgi:hypothetical protein
LTVSYELWNALVSTGTFIVVLATAIAALRQIRHLRAQNTLQGLLKILDDWHDPAFREWINYVRNELPVRMAEPGFFEDFDGPNADRARHPELYVCDWYEQVGSFMKYGLLDERTMLDVSSGSAPGLYVAVEPVIAHMRKKRGDALYENFEYFAARALIFARTHPGGCYPADTPRMRDLLTEPAPASTGLPSAVPAPERAAERAADARG